MNNIDDLIEFMTNTGIPKRQGSIRLGLDLDQDCEDQDDLEFDLLSIIALKLIRRLFGDDVTPDKMSEDDFIKLQLYFMSIGFKINYSVQTTDSDVQYKISFERCVY